MLLLFMSFLAVDSKTNTFSALLCTCFSNMQDVFVTLFEKISFHE